MKLVIPKKFLPLFFFLLFLGPLAYSQGSGSMDLNVDEKLNDFMEMLDRGYMTEFNEADLVESAIVAMLKELDPHSVYVSAKEVKAMNEPLKGNFEGVGIQFNIFEDTIMVVTPISGGPSEKLGIRSGDRIVTIDDTMVAGIGITNSDVVSKLRGDKGTKVRVGIKRRGVAELIEYTITRDKIPIFSLDAAHMLKDDIGYIKLNRFAAETVNEFKKGLSDLQDEGMKHLVLDLRGNGGGYLRAAVDLADQFVNSGEMIVYTEGRKYQRQDHLSTNRGQFKKGKLVVLIDEGSASASEIVSGAIQDWDRGIIIGRRSFGKGLVQRPFYFKDGAMVRLTVAHYYTPSGRSIQKPYDAGEKGLEEYFKERAERFNKGELTDADSIEMPDSLKFFTKNDRVVYGGGGIMPDFFVPLDTMFNTKYYRDLSRASLLYDWSLDYVDIHRDDLNNRFADVKAFIAGINGDEVLAEFIKHAEEQNVKGSEDEHERSDETIKTQLLALMARHLWKTDAYYQVINQTDDNVLKAIEVIEGDTFEKLSIK